MSKGMAIKKGALALSAMLAIACTSCTDSAAEAPEGSLTSRTSVPATSPTAPTEIGSASRPAPGSIEALQSRLAEANAELDEWFVEAMTADEIAQRFVADARASWHRRLQACADDDCRREILTDQLDRIDYANGRNASPRPGMPWATGFLEVRTEYLVDSPDAYAGGTLGIYPIIDDRLIVWASTVEIPAGRWICTMIAEGRLAGGVLEMRSLDELKRSYSFRSASRGQWKMNSPEPSLGHCGIGGLEGDYDVRVLHPNTRRDPAIARTFLYIAEEQLPQEMNQALERLRNEQGGAD